MDLFITAVNGFVGSRLARHALARGDRVSGTYLGELGESVAGLEVELFEVDLLDRRALSAAVERSEPEAVVHLAGYSHVGDSWKRMADYFRSNFLGTEHLLDAVAGEVPVVLASSSEVYGAVPEEEQPIGEGCDLAPRTPYALTKAAAERLAISRGAVVARSFNLVGPGQAARFALPAFAGQLAAIARGEAEPVLRVGNLTARRDFVHVDDGSAAYRLLAEQGVSGEVYNLASGRAFSIAEALERLMRLSGVEARVEEDPARLRPVDLPLLCGDPSRLEGLGWRRERSLEDALGDLWKAVAPC